MNGGWKNWSVARRIATVAFAAVVAWDAVALVRRMRAVEISRITPLVMPEIATVTRPPFDDSGIFGLASARNPFDGGTAPIVPLGNPLVTLPVDRPRLTGTVVQGARSFVVIELVDGAMRIVRLGESASGLTLRSVEPGAGTFIDATGRRIVLHLAPTETATRP
ncbi:MAG: hypothetical protein ABI969_01130 [bacterium]